VNPVRRPFLVLVLLLALPFVQALGMAHRVLHAPHYHGDTLHPHEVHSHEAHPHEGPFELDSRSVSKRVFEHEPSGELVCQLFDEATAAAGIASYFDLEPVIPSGVLVIDFNRTRVAARFYSRSQARGPPSVA
jgi:hypothetical protein